MTAYQVAVGALIVGLACSASADGPKLGTFVGQHRAESVGLGGSLPVGVVSPNHPITFSRRGGRLYVREGGRAQSMVVKSDQLLPSGEREIVVVRPRSTPRALRADRLPQSTAGAARAVEGYGRLLVGRDGRAQWFDLSAGLVEGERDAIVPTAGTTFFEGARQAPHR